MLAVGFTAWSDQVASKMLQALISPMILPITWESSSFVRYFPSCLPDIYHEYRSWLQHETVSSRQCRGRLLVAFRTVYKGSVDLNRGPDPSGDRSAVLSHYRHFFLAPTPHALSLIFSIVKQTISTHISLYHMISSHCVHYTWPYKEPLVNPQTWNDACKILYLSFGQLALCVFPYFLCFQHLSLLPTYPHIYDSSFYFYGFLSIYYIDANLWSPNHGFGCLRHTWIQKKTKLLKIWNGHTSPHATTINQAALSIHHQALESSQPCHTWNC